MFAGLMVAAPPGVGPVSAAGQLVSVDEAAPETDPDHNSDAGVDLTSMYAWFDGAALDTLVIALDFASTWGDVHLMVILEKNGDPAGALEDAFEFEVDYGHALKPDYVFTYKYSANDYADLRRWTGEWEYWQLVSRDWTTDAGDQNKNALSMVDKTAGQVRFRFPLEAIGDIVPGDTLRLQSYVSQEPDQTKYNALDSNPHDITNDMVPDTGNWWDTAGNRLALSQYAVFEVPAFGTPPVVSGAAASPDTVAAGETVLLSVEVTDAGGGIGEVYADLASIGGDAETVLTDDGTGGDQQAGDGVYSGLYTLPEDVSGGLHLITFFATDTSGLTMRTTTAPLVVSVDLQVFISVEDAVGDDHGPNQTDGQGNPVGGLYYLYPTNPVFRSGIYDIRKIDFMLDGPYLVLRVYTGDVLTTAEGGNWGADYPGASCTGPNKAQLNSPKIDVYIDSEEGVGATAGLPSRYVDVAEADAWEYAAAVEGWWVGLARSNGSNARGDWDIFKDLSHIDMCNDHVEDYIDIKIGLEELGNPSQEELKTWDFILTMSSHDGVSSDSNLGDIRPVNAARTEWQLGGGRNAEGGRNRDPNIIDVATVAGEGKSPGLSQELMLDYTTTEAWARFDDGLNSCRIEATSKYPGAVAGTVALGDGSDFETIATVEAYSDGDLVASTRTARGGGAYRITSLPDGTYDIVAKAQSYRAATVTGLVIEGGTIHTGIDFALVEVPGAISGTVSLPGPPQDVRVYALDAATGEISGDGIRIISGGSGSFNILAVEDGNHTLVAQARGYARFDSVVTVSGDTLDVTIAPGLARATRYTFIDSVIDIAHAEVIGLGAALGNEVYSRSVSKSLPDNDVFFFAELMFEPRDEDGSAAIYDESATDSVTIGATLLDPAVPAKGEVIFAQDGDVTTALPDDIITAEMFDGGVGKVYVSDDAVEVLRVEVSKGTRTGAIEVGVGELKPARVRLDPDISEIEVGGAERIELDVQLVDVSGNPAPEPDVGIRLEAVDGNPIFEPESDITDANGFFTSQVYGFESGIVRFTAVVEPGEFEGLPADTVEVVFRPGPAVSISAVLAPSVVKLGGESDLTLQIIDSFGNPVPGQPVQIDLSIFPQDLLASFDAPVFTDAGGKAVSHLVAGDGYGLVNIEPISAYPAESVKLSIDARLVSVDEAAPESDPAHNSDPDVDLTNMFAWADSDTLIVALDFTSTWSDVHLMVALEKNRDMGGGNQDPFQFQIFYRHAWRPDYVFTYKYSAQDYSDLRRWNEGWEFWYLDGEFWSPRDDEPYDKNALGIVVREDTRVLFKFPLTAIGEVSPGDTLRLQSYVTQEPFQTKYNALDSNPHDDTQDMDPDQGEWWETATVPKNLSKWAEYVLPVTAETPVLSDPVIDPDVTSPGEVVNFSVGVEDAGGGIGDVFADLSPIGGDATQRLADDGTAGDETASDGTYSINFTIPAVVTQGIHTIRFTARDALNVVEVETSAQIEIINPPEIIIAVTDSIGDDHGPNITDQDGNPEDGLYYFYPTNGVFVDGAYDIEKVEFMIDGAFLVLRTHVGEIPSSEAVGWNAPYPGATCTNPNKADLNLQKIDVYIDSKEGSGATAGLPFRFVDIGRSDAWEYAVAIEGWWRGLIASNGQNSSAFWTIMRQTTQLDFCNDHIENYIDIKIALAELGDPTADDIRKWDFIITLASHDGNSDDQNLGGSRWVNNAVSEWQFGNGRDGEAGRERDANIMDVVTVPGEGKLPGRSQEEMLNYLTDDAIRRFDNGLTACILEATSSVDISPPKISPFATDGFAHAVWYILESAPASFWTKVEDENFVDSVTFYWRPLGILSWNRVEMVNIVDAYWIADVNPDDLASAVSPIDLVDGTPARPFEAVIEAVDEYGNRAQTPLLTFAVPVEALALQTLKGIGPGETAVFYDGTIVTLPDAAALAPYDSLDVTISPPPPPPPADWRSVDPTTYRSTMTPLGVRRLLEMTGYNNDEPEELETLPKPLRLALHYPAYLTLSVTDEGRIGMFRFNDITDRWIGMFGSVNSAGNAVAADVAEAGAYGLFVDSRLAFDPGEGLSGVVAEPNPFSPNGDGVYDETGISFHLSREADWVTIEIYDITGAEVRTIRWQKGLTETGRSAFEIIWDGRDDNDNIVPYGIYIARLEVRFKVAPFNERENIAIVVIK
jgi:hypothetical protein